MDMTSSKYLLNAMLNAAFIPYACKYQYIVILLATEYHVHMHTASILVGPLHCAAFK